MKLNITLILKLLAMAFTMAFALASTIPPTPPALTNDTERKLYYPTNAICWDEFSTNVYHTRLQVGYNWQESDPVLVLTNRPYLVKESIIIIKLTDTEWETLRTNWNGRLETNNIYIYR